MKKVIHDIVIRPDLCNVRCNYCGLTIEKCPKLEINEKNEVGRYFNHKKSKNFESPEEILNRTKKLIRNINNHVSYPIIKLSGGEILAIPNLINLVFWCSERFPIVQFLTNGILLTSDLIQRISAYPNIHIQISLDGNTLKSNKYRGGNVSHLESILNSISEIIKLNIPLEINTVLSNANVKEFMFFVNWIDDQKGKSNNSKITIWPRPVRGERKDVFAANHIELLDLIDSLIKNKTTSLPPKEYLHSMKSIIQEKRTFFCYVPQFVLGTEDNGKLPICTCSSSLGALHMNNESSDALKQLNYTFINTSQCKTCMNQYEILSMYYHGLVNEEVLKRIELYKEPIVLNYINNVCDYINEYHTNKYST